MEVLVLIDFEGTLGDEMTVQAGDVVKNVSKAKEEGWLEGDLRGKRGIFPANFVKEVPVYLIGDSKREPRSIRTSKVKQSRKCEVAFSFSPMNEDELELVVGETVEILREIEDGWWMGLKNGKVGAFPSNFVIEIFVSPKDVKLNEGKTRPKLSDAVFSQETKLPQRTSVRNKTRNVKECCQVMFDYPVCTDDELELKKGDIVTIISKETEDEGWWEGELNGRSGFFPDNFVMVIPTTDALQSGNRSQPPIRCGAERRSVKAEASAMEKGSPAKTQDEKPESKDLRSNPPIKVKLPSICKPVPPPVKDKPTRFQHKTNGDNLPPSPKRPEESDSDQFDAVDVSTEKLSHLTANRVKPPHRRPPSVLTATHTPSDETEAETSPKKTQTEKFGLPKAAENLSPPPGKAEQLPETTPPPLARSARPRVEEEGRGARDEKPPPDSLQAEVRELRMALELLQTQHKQDVEELKVELGEERRKRTTLQEEVHRLLQTKH